MSSPSSSKVRQVVRSSMYGRFTGVRAELGREEKADGSQSCTCDVQRWMERGSSVGGSQVEA
jgi:hypothetical protein